MFSTGSIRCQFTVKVVKGPVSLCRLTSNSKSLPKNRMSMDYDLPISSSFVETRTLRKSKTRFAEQASAYFKDARPFRMIRLGNLG